jgi:hypothetical protein
VPKAIDLERISSASFRMGLWLGITIQPNARQRVEEGLPQCFDENIRHFYEAGLP